MSIMKNEKTDHSDWYIHHRIATVADLGKRLTFRLIADNNLAITPDQWSVLYHLWEEDGLTMGELANKARKEVSNVSRIVERLQQLDYVSKQKKHRDSRKTAVYVLPKGYTVRAAVHRNCVPALSHAFKGITPEEQDLFLKILSRIESNIEEKLEALDS